MKPWRKIVSRDYESVNGKTITFVTLECGHRIPSKNHSRARCYSCHPPQQTKGFPHKEVERARSLGFKPDLREFYDSRRGNN